MTARRMPIIIVACLACLVTGPLAGAASARPGIRLDPGLVRVVQPVQDEPFFGALRVVLAVQRGVRIDTADLSGRSVKRDLRRVSATRLVAEVPRRVIGTGPRVLRITATSADARRRDHDLVPLLAAVRKRSLLTVRVRRLGSGTAPVDISVITHPVRAGLRLWLNGRRIDGRVQPGGLGVRVLRVTARDGLRLGRNTITATAHDGRRFADREAHVLIEPRTAPLPGLAYTLRARTGGIAWLDAATTLRLHRGDRLSFRWTIVSAPRGSRRRLTAHSGVRVRLLPDRPGHYRVRLVASERLPRRGTGRTAGARVTRAGGPTATASVTVPLDVTVPLPAFGIRLSTTTSGTAAGIDYAGIASVHAAGDGGITTMIIDRSTGQPTAGDIPGVNGAPDIGTLATDILQETGPLAPQQGETDLVVLTGEASGSSPDNNNSSAIDALADALGSLGVDQDEVQSDAHAIASGQPFTVIGFPGQPQGTAYANFDSTADDAGSLSGYIRDTGRLLGNLSALDFQPSQLISFAAGPTGAQIDAPPGQITVAVPPAGGFSISVLDAHSLRLIGTVTSHTGPGQTVGSVNDPTTPLGFLQAHVADPTKLILLLWNGYTVNYSDRNNYYDLLNDLASIGVNRDLLIRSFQAPNPADTTFEAPIFLNQPYTFLGGAGVSGIDGSPLKLLDSQNQSGGTASCPTVVPYISNPSNGQQCIQVSGANVQGFLADDQHGRLEPRAATTSTQPGLQSALTQLADERPTLYTYPTSPAGTAAQYAAAEARLYRIVDAVAQFCNSTTTNCSIVNGGMRVNYGSPQFYDKIDSVLSALHCPLPGQSGTMPSSFYASTSQYTLAQLAALWSQVCPELIAIQGVHENTFSPLESAVSGSQLSATLDLIATSSIVKGFIDQTTTVPGLNVVDLISRIAEFASVVADLAGEEDIGEPLAFVSSGLGIGAEFTNQPKSSDDDALLEQSVGAMASWLQDNGASAAAALGELEGIIYSDPSKLQTAFANESQKPKPWNLSGETTIITNTISDGDANYIYPRLLAAANPKSCKEIWSGTAQIYQPNAWSPPAPSSDPLTYFAETNPIVAVNPTGTSIPFSFGAYIQALKLSSANAQTLAQALFEAPTVADLNGSATPPAPGGAPLGSLDRSDLSLMLQNAANNTSCEAPQAWVQNGP